MPDDLILEGRHIRLEPLSEGHVDGLVAAAAADPPLYRWTFVPQGKAETQKYVATALEWKDAGTAIPFAIVRLQDEAVIGSTRFFEVERWPWPDGHPFHGRLAPDVCQIGYTWFTRAAIRTGANTEAKFLMLAHAFDSWQVKRVCLHTDARNERSRAAIQRLGARFEGILRAHRLAPDFIPRDSARFSIVASEWPEVKQRLTGFLNHGAGRAQSQRLHQS